MVVLKIGHMVQAGTLILKQQTCNANPRHIFLETLDNQKKTIKILGQQYT